MSAWLSVLVASTLGSLHCVGMCGGLVGIYAAREDAGTSRWAPHLAYHVTRLAAYVGLGAAAGQLGATLDGMGSRIGFGSLGVSLASLALAFWVLPLLLGRVARERLLIIRRSPERVGPLRRLERLFGTLAQGLQQRPPVWRASALGLFSALLPCGWLYAFVVLAAGAGSASSGACLLLAFWAGTVPALLGLAVGIERMAAPLRARLPRLSATLVAIACVFNIASRWPSAWAANTSNSTPSCHHAN